MTMIFFVALSLVGIFAVFANSLFKINSRPAFLLGWYLLAFADIVLIGEIAGTLGLLNSRLFFLFGHLFLASLAGIAWCCRGRPSLLGPFSRFFATLKREAIEKSLKNWPDLWILGVAVLWSYAIGAGLIPIVPANIDDALTAYLPRAGHWLQTGSLHPWPTQSPYYGYIVQTIYPINAQLLILWSLLFSGTDQLAGFVQWLAAPVSVIAIYGISQLLGSSRPQALFAGLIWLTFPQVIMQSTSCLTDLVASGLVIAIVYLLYLGLKSRSKGALLLSALALGLALGTKFTNLFVLPGLLLTVVMICFQQKPKIFKLALTWGIACAVAFIFWGSYTYIMNLAAYGHPQGPPDIYVYVDEDIPISLVNHLKQIAVNVTGFIYNSLGTNGLPKTIAALIERFKTGALRYLFSLTGLTVRINLYHTNPLFGDFPWYGPLPFFLLLPAVFCNIWAGIRKNRPYHLGLIFCALSNLLLLSYIKPWTSAMSRYCLMSVTLCVPLIAPIFRRGKLFDLLCFIITGIALLVMLTTVLFNQNKPLAGPESVWTMNRINMQCNQSVLTRQFAPILTAIEEVVPQQATLGVILKKFPVSALMGKHYRRKLIYIYPYSRATDLDWLAKQNIEFILVDLEDLPFQRIPKGMVSMDQTKMIDLGKNDVIVRTIHLLKISKP